jgi:hypothetical protein
MVQIFPDPELTISLSKPFKAISIYLIHTTLGLVNRSLKLEVEVCGLEKIVSA